MMRESPAATCRPMSAQTPIWFCGFFSLFAWLASIISFCASPARPISRKRPLTLASS